MQETGLFWHLHHKKLIEWCHGYKERETYIRTDKPKYERETRLRLFKPVMGNLPKEVIDAGQAHGDAVQAFDKVYHKAGQSSETWQARREIVKACRETRQAFNEAVKNNMSAIEALHREECPDCPWDGHTIFPKAA